MVKHFADEIVEKYYRAKVITNDRYLKCSSLTEDKKKQAEK